MLNLNEAGSVGVGGRDARRPLPLRPVETGTRRLQRNVGRRRLRCGPTYAQRDVLALQLFHAGYRRSPLRSRISSSESYVSFFFFYFFFFNYFLHSLSVSSKNSYWPWILTDSGADALTLNRLSTAGDERITSDRVGARVDCSLHQSPGPVGLCCITGHEMVPDAHHLVLVPAPAVSFSGPDLLVLRVITTEHRNNLHLR